MLVTNERHIRVNNHTLKCMRAYNVYMRKSITFLWCITTFRHSDWLPFLPCAQSYHKRFNILKNQLVVLRITNFCICDYRHKALLVTGSTTMIRFPYSLTHSFVHWRILSRYYQCATQRTRLHGTQLIYVINVTTLNTMHIDENHSLWHNQWMNFT